MLWNVGLLIALHYNIYGRSNLWKPSEPDSRQIPLRHSQEDPGLTDLVLSQLHRHDAPNFALHNHKADFVVVVLQFLHCSDKDHF